MSRLGPLLLAVALGLSPVSAFEMWPDVETRSLVTTDPDNPPWQEPLPLETPTRQTYFDVLRAWTDNQWPWRSGTWCGNESPDIGHFAFEYAALYRASCDEGSCNESHAQRALDMLQRNHQYITCQFPAEFSHCSCAGTPVIANSSSASFGVAESSLLLAGSPSITPLDRSQIDAMIARLADEDIVNSKRLLSARYLSGAVSMAASATALPNHPRAPAWRANSNLVFDQVRERWHHQSDAGHYIGQLAFPFLVRIVELQPDAASLWADEGWLGLLDDYAALSFTGTLPSFGDSIGFPVWNTGSLYVWETAAARTGDPFYKWLAYRAWNVGNRLLYGNALTRGQQSLEWWGYAALTATDAVAPAPPSSFPSQLLMRPAASYASDLSDPLFATWLPFDQPDKLILSSGTDPDEGCYAVFNLGHRFSHTQREIGALSLLWCDGSALVIDGDNPYWSAGINRISTEPVAYAQPGRHIKRPYDESTAGVDHEGTPYPDEAIGFPMIPLRGTMTSAAAITKFEDSADSTVVWMEWADPSGTGAQHEQRVYWSKHASGFLWIRNRVEMPPAGLNDVNFGHVLRVHDVHADSGADWNAFFTAFSHTNNLPSRNVRRMAIAYHVPRPGQQRRAFTIPDLQPPIADRIAGWPDGVPDCSGFAADETVSAGAPLAANPSADCRRGSAHAITQVRVENGLATGSEWFDTVILPFDPDEETPAEARARVAGVTVSPDGEGVQLEVQLGAERICARDDGAATSENNGFLCAEAVPVADGRSLTWVAFVLMLAIGCWGWRRGAR